MSRKFSLLRLACLMVLLLSASMIHAQQDQGTCQLISLFNGWARAAGAGMPTSAVYGLVVNLGAQADTLIGGHTDAADALEVHQMSMDSAGVMHMNPVEGGLPIPANAFAALEPGGYHIMLIGLHQMLDAGTMLDITLTFANAGDVQVSVPVRDSNDSMGSSMGSMATSDTSMGGSTDMATPDTGMGGSMDMATPDMSMGSPTQQSITAIPDGCAQVFVVDPWVRPAGAGMDVSAGYALLLNLTDADVTLTQASGDVASSVELHEMSMDANGVMHMQPLENGLVVPAYGASVLQPGSYHIMLIGLQRQLAVGDTVDLTLTFDNGTVIPLSFPVREPPATPMS